MFCKVLHSTNDQHDCVTLLSNGSGGCEDESFAVGDHLAVHRVGDSHEDHNFREFVVASSEANRLVIQATTWPKLREAGDSLSSHNLLEGLEVGECVTAVGPYQKFTADHVKIKPITMISDGAGLYTLLPIVDALSQEADNKSSLWIHRTLDVDMLLQSVEFRRRLQECTGLKTHFYNLPPEEFRRETLGFTSDGRMTAVKLGEMHLPDASEYLVAGGRDFVQETMNDLLGLEVLLSDIKHLVVGSGNKVRPTRIGEFLSGSA